jgi:hypothetical protein
VKCRICGHEHVSVIGEDGPKLPASDSNWDGFEIENQECPECGNMTCDPTGSGDIKPHWRG